jgi:hypothetical protein
MVLLWLGLGALIGIVSAPPEGGVIGLVAGALAGMIVLPVLGGLFGIFGGGWRACLVGAACGFVMGIAVAMFSGSPRFAPSVSLHLLVGACAGATLPQICRLHMQLARQLAAQLRSFRTDITGVSAASHDGAINP